VQDLAIVVPLKEFVRAKTRLREGGIVDVDERIRQMARDVLAASSPRPVFVSCESDDVEEFARECSVACLRSSSSSLNEAVADAYQKLSRRFRRLMIVHADLRRPDGLGSFDPPGDATIVTDHHGQGTNVLVIPTGLDFAFQFGPDSAYAHMIEAQRIGLDVHVVRDSPWGFDVDEPDDIVD